MTGFPLLRSRRLRQTEPLRALVRETRISVGDLVYPIFVVEGNGQKTGNSHHARHLSLFYRYAARGD